MASLDALPGMAEADRRIERSVEVLRSATEQLKPPRAGETREDLAVRLKGAAVLAATAALEISTVAGWNEAAHAAAEAAVRDGEERDDG
jgi:hypothetical protein